MKIPKNMTEESVLDKIDIVVNRIAPKYTFTGFDLDDIKQESFIICLDALNRYDQKRPLENFLSVNLSNRLKNFVRDNNFTKSDEEKRKVLLPKQLSHEYTVEDENHLESHYDYKEMMEIIDENLDRDFRSDYLKILNDVHVCKKRKDEILDVIRNILEEKGYA